MRSWVWSTTGVVVAVFVAAASWLITAPGLFATADLSRISEEGDSERGKLVFAADDCAFLPCLARTAGPLASGWWIGACLAVRDVPRPNISMDRVDGIGNWTTRDLANALLNGVSPVGSHYYPRISICELHAYARRRCAGSHGLSSAGWIAG
jgi:hypothetical protein